jgi:hypothetical protein
MEFPSVINPIHTRITVRSMRAADALARNIRAGVRADNRIDAVDELERDYQFMNWAR